MEKNLRIEKIKKFEKYKNRTIHIGLIKLRPSEARYIVGYPSPTWVIRIPCKLRSLGTSSAWVPFSILIFILMKWLSTEQRSLRLDNN